MLLMNRQRVKSFRLRNESKSHLCVQECTKIALNLLQANQCNTFCIKLRFYQINGLFELKTRQNEEMSSSPEHASLEVLRVCTSYHGGVAL